MNYLYLIIGMLTIPLVLGAGTNPTDSKNKADIYFDNLLAGKYEVCWQMSSPDVQNALSATRLKETWESLSTQMGGYIGVIKNTIENKPAEQVHIYALNFSKMVLDMKITLDNQGVVTGLLFTPSSVDKPGTSLQLPDYLGTDTILATPVQFDCQGFAVHGMLTLPVNMQSYPVVLMMSGSGPNDMDENVGVRKPFRDIANGLANKGIATLRWTKRTRDYPESYKGNESFTVQDEYLPETLSALTYLGKRDDINITGYFLLGHSMGGYMLPIAAKELPDISGCIMLAANARPLEDLVVEQYRYIFGLGGMTPEKQKALDKIITQAQEVKQLSTDKPAPDTLLLGVPKAYWLSLNNYNQVAVFRSTTVPFLILQGGKDYQVSMTDYLLWKNATRNKKHIRLLSYPNLDHLFMQCDGASTPDSYLTPAFVSEKVIDDIALWIKQNSH